MHEVHLLESLIIMASEKLRYELNVSLGGCRQRLSFDERISKRSCKLMVRWSKKVIPAGRTTKGLASHVGLGVG